MLRLENAHLELGSKVLFRDLNVHLEAGQLLNIAGPNGIGKSSLLKVLVGQVPLSKGSILWNCKHRCYVPQLANMSFHINLTLRDVLSLFFNRDHCHSDGRRDLEKSVLELGLLDSASLDLCWNSASGGERQRTLLTQAFLSGSEVLILDEPTNHLDKERSAKVFELMKAYASDGKRSLIYVSHDTPVTPSDLSNVALAKVEVEGAPTGSGITTLNLRDYQ